MKLPHGRRAHEDARPAWRLRLACLRMLAFRRQHHREIATVLRGFDATERHITELYAKAVEQLRSDEAPVRSGGLYALERLAQDNSVDRQIIVNVICAYLRMPFSPTAPASKAEPEAEGQKEPGSESEAGTDGIGCTWQQERQVRLTAQRILAEHLRDDRSKEPSADPSNSRFWNNIRLELTGATLIDFNLVNSVMAAANFHRVVFSGDALFGGAVFSGAAFFGGAVFSGAANFPGAAFRGDALFGGAAFSRGTGFRRAAFGGVAGFHRAAFGGVAGFHRATFGGDAWFDEATFGGDAWFDKATIGGAAFFGGAVFGGAAGFGGAVFGGAAGFGGASFTGDAWFGGASFTGDAWFGGAAFSGDAGFDMAAFSGDVWFGEAAFSGHAWFGEATFSGGGDALHFEQARILSPGASHAWPTGWRLADTDGGGCTVVRANDDGGS